MRHFAILAGVLTLFSGCSKKNEAVVEDTSAAATEQAPAPAPKTDSAAPAAAPEEDGLPGSSDVRDALARQDYQGAVDRLAALKGLAVAGNAWIKYRELTGEVGLALSEAAKTNSAAAQALAAYRISVYGR